MSMARVNRSALILFLSISMLVLFGCGGTNGTSMTSSSSTIATPSSITGKVTPLSTEQPVPPVSSFSSQFK